MKTISRDFKAGAVAAIVQRLGAHGSSSRENAELHCHPAPEFCLVTQGFSRFIIGSSIHSLAPASLVWLPAGQPHVLIDQSRDHRMLIASFRPLFVNENAGPECSAALLRKETSRKELARKISRKSTLLIESLLLELDSMNDESGNFAKAGFSFVFDYAWRAFCASAEESARKETHPAVEKALGLLMRGNTEKLTALARASGLSPSALCRLFKAQTGLSIVDYKNKLKVARFIELYGDGRKNNMTAAAYEAGFGSYAQFYRIFAQITGTSPRQYQKQRPG